MPAAGLAAAAGLSLGVAYAGISYIIAQPKQLGLPVGAWSLESGVWITLLGLILAIVGLAVLIAAALRRSADAE